VIRHHTSLIRKYEPPSKAKKLLLLPEEYATPFHERATVSPSIETWERFRGGHVCTYSLTYAIIPLELVDAFPLSQTETSIMPTPSAVSSARRRISDYIKRFGYSRCLIIGFAPWHTQLAVGLKQRFKGKVRIRFLEERELDKKAVQRISKAFK
jgi:hypothetical protein